MKEMKLRVLVVDDEAAARYTVINLLERIDFCVLAGEADSGFRALEMIEKTSPDVVLADVSMPGMDGIELARLIHEKYPQTKVIMLTMHSNFDFAVQAFRLGVVDYVLKDAYNMAPLRTALEKAGREIDERNTSEMVYLDRNLRLQIENKSYIGKTGKFVKFYLKEENSTFGVLVDRYRRFDGNCCPVTEDIWLVSDTVSDGNAYTYLDTVVTATEDTLNTFVQAEGEHFYFPGIFKLSGLLYSGTIASADKAKILCWYRDFICGKMENFPGDFAALCIEGRIAPDTARKTLMDCVNSVSENSNGFIKQIERARSIHEIEIALKAALLTEQLEVRKSNHIIDEVKRYIEEHINSELGLKVLSEVAGLSPAYLSTYFKQETGTGIKQYIQETRLSKAAGLLKTTNMKVYEIAEKCGFMNVSYFSEQFTKYYGITPQRYRIK